MNYERINFKNGQLVSPGSVDLVTGELTMPVYEGETPINDVNLNKMDEAIEYLFENGVGGGGSGNDAVGSIKLWPTDTPPKGYLICDGSAISRTIYADLFNVIGTTYGAGDGTTTFNIPNIKGRVVVGKDSSDTDFDTLGETGGEKEHTLTGDEMPKHNHNGVFTINDSNIGTASVGTGEQTGWRQSNGSYGIQIQVPNAGDSQPHNNLQPYIVEHYIIKATKEATEETTVEAIPAGAIVEYEGTEVPVGYEEVEDNKIVIFNGSATTDETLTLNKSLLELGNILGFIFVFRYNAHNYTCSVFIPYETFKPFSDAFENTNAFFGFFGGESYIIVKCIPHSDITETTMKFSISDSNYIIRKIIAVKR